jgi:octaprenyl-diphosphate synthase
MAAAKAAIPSAEGDVSADVVSILDRYRPELELCRHRMLQRLRDDGVDPALVDHAARGKMLRALLVLAAGRAVGGEPTALIPGAEAIELLHSASLVHDDIVDEAAERRGREALHVRVGERVALVLGDYLLLTAFAVLADAPAIPPNRVLAATTRLGAHARRCALGEAAELLAAGQACTEEGYLELVRAKTSSAFAAAAAVGVLFGGGSPEQVVAAETYADALGVAFQIRDDVLDLTGDAERLGKPVGNSLAHRRPLLPLVYLESSGSPAARHQACRLAHEPSQRLELLNLLEREGALARTERTQRRHVDAACSALAVLGPSPESEVLAALARYAVARDR